MTKTTGRRMRLDTFDKLDAFLAGENERRIPDLRDTRVVRSRETDPATGLCLRHSISVYYHRTPVVTHETINGRMTVTFNTGGWQTVTTKSRMNQFSPIGVYQRQGQWYVAVPNPDGTPGSGRLVTEFQGDTLCAQRLDNGSWAVEVS